VNTKYDYSIGLTVLEIDRGQRGQVTKMTCLGRGLHCMSASSCKIQFGSFCLCVMLNYTIMITS